MVTTAEFTAARTRGDVRILARLLTAAENEPADVYGELQKLEHDSGQPPAHVIGVTGPPGVGKSTLVNALMGEIRREGFSVAVLAVDPSSPFKGGALLGDRVRMSAFASDSEVYIRSMATRGVLGGLARATWLAVRILEMWGFDWILVETAGVGQNEIDIVHLADTTMLVMSPAAGDDVQVMKAGIMEAADLFVINKSDLPGADRVKHALLSVLPHDPAVVCTVANGRRGQSGAHELFLLLQNRHAEARAPGRLQRVREEVRRAALEVLNAKVVETMSDMADSEFATLADPRGVARAVIRKLCNLPDRRREE